MPKRLTRTATRAATFFAVLVGAGFMLGANDTARADSFTGAYLAARHAEARQDVMAASEFYIKALRRRPQAEDLLEPAMFYSLAAGEFVRGLRLAYQVAALEPDDQTATLALAVEAFREGRFDEVQELLNNDEVYGAGLLLSKMLSAWADVAKGEAAQAIEDLTAEEPQALFRLFARYHAGLIASTVGDYDTAADAFEQAIEAGGGPTRRLALAYGAALERAGRSEDAIALYEEVSARDAGDAPILAAIERAKAGRPADLVVRTVNDGAAEALYGLGAALGQEDGARFALIYGQLALALNPGLDVAHILTGDVFESLERYEAAEASFAQVSEESVNYNLAQLGRATSLDRLDRDDEALATMRQLSERAPDDASVYFAIGQFFSRHERFEECVDAYDDGFERLDRTVDRHWALYYGRGICLERTGNWERAEENFTLALELNPGQPDVLNYLGYSLVEQGRRLEEAKTMIEDAVEARPDSGYIVDSLGWVLYRLGDFDGAVEQLARAVSLNPVEPVIVDHYGDALWQVGRKMEARFQWMRALSFDPEEDVVRRIERKLDVGLDVVLEEEAAAATDRDGGVNGQPGASGAEPENAEAADDEVRVQPRDG